MMWATSVGARLIPFKPPVAELRSSDDSLQLSDKRMANRRGSAGNRCKMLELGNSEVVGVGLGTRGCAPVAVAVMVVRVRLGLREPVPEAESVVDGDRELRAERVGVDEPEPATDHSQWSASALLTTMSAEAGDGDGQKAMPLQNEYGTPIKQKQSHKCNR